MNTADAEYEYMVLDAVLIINNHLERNAEEPIDEENLEFYSITALTHNAIIENTHVKWLAEVVLCIPQITLDEYFERAHRNTMVTREEFLGLLRFLLEKGTGADEIRTLYLKNDYCENEKLYRGKPIESILKNDLYRYMSEFIN